ncbi:uncharacterized protein B0H18DRAFT_873777 [Fomitopsis serialis]|uniref:uncharacterized protein n=1 Tax=Fomitopsis serialis TaxID=139415 RepID=UPI00200767E3|nr:uncharacterized protein B0H18DRAFT_873777 [Neoantrodia serialis]KAH9929699.1 hypothetical protein B0H18DRAFT_873777 [Neoantrodia serialis]
MQITTQKEQDDVNMLMTLMGDAVSVDVALKVLRKHNGDMDKAASALLEGDLGEVASTMDTSWAGGPAVGPRTPPRKSTPEKDTSVIDLTAEDEDKELSRALQASLEGTGAHFGPSERAPDPNWAVVPSNVATSGVDPQDESLSRAIAASLEDAPSLDHYDELPLEERLRRDKRPVALRPTSSPMAYAGLLLQSLYYVPQLRHAIARWGQIYFEKQTRTQEDAEISPQEPGPDLLVWSMMEIFANMEIALLSELNSDRVIQAFSPEPWGSPIEHPGDPTFAFYSRIARTVESSVQDEPDRLFHFRYGVSTEDLSKVPFDGAHDLSVVKVDVRGTEDANDLVTCLSSELGLTGAVTPATKQRVIFEPSDIVAFQLVRDNMLPSYETSIGARTERTTFKYPKHVYLDQYLAQNLALGNKLREKQQSLTKEIEELSANKLALTRHKDRDTLTDLRSSLHYYENVAEDAGDAIRKTTIQDMALKLRKILTRIENELQSKDYGPLPRRVENEGANLFNIPELRQHRYDLRVVLVHDGLYGRKHLYSYVKEKGTWWKTQDYLVTEVRHHSGVSGHQQVPEETVLNDCVGLHLGAGPYFLVYSRALSEEEENVRAHWLEGVKNSVKHNNEIFLSQLPTQLASQVQDPNSPPTSPYRSQAPSEYTMSSGTVEPPQSREDLMDVDS